jgi:hypothetical protein
MEERIAADRKYARNLVKQDRTAAQWLRAILGSERRRTAVADALAGALKNSSNGNDKPAESVEAGKQLNAAADDGVAA